ncbi:MAG: matrixin family metalloprotease, partial [Syntrophales bacterium]
GAGRERGGVKEAVYRQLTAEKDGLNNMHAKLRVCQEKVKMIADVLNNMTVVINDIAHNYNLEAIESQDTGKRLGSEFSGGDYFSRAGKETITIYQFDDHDRLLRVLAHEFGHALGLKHNDNPDAIMYRLMHLDSLNLAPDDIAALKGRCGD